ncbi:hypothetical protein ABIA33_004642 [Streptacidiphilus sp. MAP12-16]
MSESATARTQQPTCINVLTVQQRTRTLQHGIRHPIRHRIRRGRRHPIRKAHLPVAELTLQSLAVQPVPAGRRPGGLVRPGLGVLEPFLLAPRLGLRCR